MNTPDYSSILFDPESVGIHGSEYLKLRIENKDLAVKTGIADIDNEDSKGNLLLPLLPGDVLSILGRPGCGKTSFMMAWARRRAAILKARKDNKRVVVYVSLEQTVEELNAFNVAAERRISITKMAQGEITPDEWKLCLKEAVNRRFMPLWCIGYSGTMDRKQIRIDASTIEGALGTIQERGHEIDMVFVDYLQRMPYDRAESKTIGVSDNLDALKTMALKLHFPVAVGVQATRDVDDKDPAIPTLGDGQWTSNIEQTSDKVLSIVRPIIYKKIGMEFFGRILQSPNETLVSVLKQKLGPTNFSRWLFFDPVYNFIDSLDRRRES